MRSSFLRKQLAGRTLERALSELGRAFSAERGAAYLALSEQEEV